MFEPTPGSLSQRGVELVYGKASHGLFRVRPAFVLDQGLIEKCSDRGLFFFFYHRKDDFQCVPVGN